MPHPLLQDTLHHDYLDEVNNKVPDETPQLIILALEPFQLLYESDLTTNGSLNTVAINRGQAVLFTSSLCHASESNGTNADTSWKYCLFAYIIVSELCDFPSEVTRVNMNYQSLQNSSGCMTWVAL